MIENKKKIISITLVIILMIGFVVYLITNNNSSNIKLDEILMEDSNKINNETNEEKSEVNYTEENTKEIVIHITGEVKKEGVIYLQKGSRIIDAIKKAGGETDKADLTQVNLAYILQDGQKIHIPNKNEKNSEYITENIGDNVEENNTLINKKEEKKVNINTAGLEELDQLPGIGPSIAQRIIDYRTEHGEFKAIEDIQEVKGIGNAKYIEIKDNITI